MCRSAWVASIAPSLGSSMQMVDSVRGSRRSSPRGRAIGCHPRQWRGDETDRLRFLNRMSFENVLVEALMGAGSLAVLTSGAVLVSQGDLRLHCRC